MFPRTSLKRLVPLLARSRERPKSPKLAKYCPVRFITCSSISSYDASSCLPRSHYRPKKLRSWNESTGKLRNSTSGPRLKGQYSSNLVNVALFEVVARNHSKSTLSDITQAIHFHFETNQERFTNLADSMFAFYSYKRKLDQPFDTIPHVVINMLRNYLQSLSHLDIDDHITSLVSSFSHEEDSVDLLSLVEFLSVFGDKRNTCISLYSSGIGTVLPELRTLTAEFDFTALSSISPVLKKISSLVSEFDEYIAKKNDYRYDANSLKLFVNVLRYRRLYDAMISQSNDKLLAIHLLAIANDPDADEIQAQLNDLSGDKRQIESFVFSTHRNFFNAIYVSIGLVDFDKILAFLNREVETDHYTVTEKHLIRDFIDSILPLLCNGLVRLDEFSKVKSKVKYACIPARHEDNIIVPFKFTKNIFDNYELSLAILFEVPSRLHLIRLVKPEIFGPETPPTMDPIINSIREYFASSSELLKADSQVLVHTLLEMNHYLLRGPTMLRMLALDPKLSLVALAQRVTSSTVDTRNTVAIDLTTQDHSADYQPPHTKTVTINNHEISDYKLELMKFRSIDLNNETYVEIGLKFTLKYLEERMRYIAIGEHSLGSSAVTSENVERFVQLYELLAASYDLGSPLEPELDLLVGKAMVKNSENANQKSDYAQIPDDLKLHDLHAQIEIFRTDELKRSYSSLSLTEILTRLKRRVEELSKEHPKDHSQSRMTLQNVLWFKKLLSRLNILFSSNGGNTEVLDALIRSQEVFSQFETKLSKKKKIQAERESSVRSDKFSGPYLQIPEDLQLHEYHDELKKFKENDLGSKYENFTAEEIIDILSRRINEIIKDSQSKNASLIITRGNFRAFALLLSKLKRLFTLNGGCTAILDTMIKSQTAFEMFEKKLADKKVAKVVEADTLKTVYIELPDEVILEDYSEELSQLKLRIGGTFESVNVSTILSNLQSMMDETIDVNEKLVLGKLSLNLRKLFKMNNNHTFILDNALISAEKFAGLEKEIRNASATENVFFMSSDSDATLRKEGTEEDYVLSLLMNKEELVTSENENIIETALRSAMDPKPIPLVRDEEIFQQISPEYHTRSKSTNDTPEPIDKETLENFLRKAKSDNETKLERQWRERKAYEWSSGMVKGNGNFETRTFFDPLFVKSSRFPMFPPSRKREHEYLVLTGDGTIIASVDNPLGSSHVPEDMFDILERLSASELANFSKSLRKLQKREWKLIGGRGRGTEKFLVLRRNLHHLSHRFWHLAKSLIGAVVIVLVTSMCLNYWLEEKKLMEVGSVQSLDKKEGSLTEIVNEQLSFVANVRDREAANLTTGNEKLWRLLLWK